MTEKYYLNQLTTNWGNYSTNDDKCVLIFSKFVNKICAYQCNLFSKLSQIIFTIPFKVIVNATSSSSVSPQ